MKSNLFFSFLFFVFVSLFFSSRAYACECPRTIGVLARSFTLGSAFEEDMVNWLSEKLNDSCLSIVHIDQAEKPEYILSVHYEESDDGRLSTSDHYRTQRYGMDGSYRRSAFAVVLLYSHGNKRIFSHTGGGNVGIGIWDTIGSNQVVSFGTQTIRMSFEEHKELMGQKLSAILPLSNYLEKYEQIPQKSILEPEKDVLLPGEIMKIGLKDFKDKWGESTRGDSYLRFTVKAEKGRVQEYDNPQIFWYNEYKILHEKGYVLANRFSIGYKAPIPEDGCYEDFEDTLRIYNSCNVLNHYVSPMDGETECKEEIAKLTIKIKCPRSRIIVSRAEHTVYTDQASFENGAGDVNGFRKREFRDEKLAAMTAQLKLKASYPMGENFCDLYMIENPKLMNNNFFFRNVLHSELGDTYVDESRIGRPSFPDLYPQAGQPVIITYNNPKREKIIDFTLPGYTAILKWTMQDERYVKHKNGEEETYSNSFEKSEYFAIERKGFDGTLMSNSSVKKNLIHGENSKHEIIDEATSDNGTKKGVKFKKFEWSVFLNNN